MTEISYDKPVTRSAIARNLRALGVQPGGIVMVHTSMSAIGWVIGGAESVIRALFDVIGPEGTLLAYIGWEDEPPQPLEDLPPTALAAVRAEHPAYDPLVAHARNDHGRVPEALRVWPGAVHSGHPESGIVAIGRRAGEIAHPHPTDNSYGLNTPYARLVSMRGQVLLIGAPLDTTTLIHHAESIADVPGKARVRYEYPIHDESGNRIWQEFNDIDTSTGALPYDQKIAEPYVEYLAGQALEAGAGVTGPIGYGEGYCFDAAQLVEVSVATIERWFSGSADEPE